MTKERRGAEAIVTTSRKAAPSLVAQARSLAALHGLPFVERHDLRIDQLARDQAVLVVGGEGILLHARGTTFRYHPGMAVNRIRTMRQGRRDWMVAAMELREGDHVLDATLGLGSDLLVASYVVGGAGRAVGLESEALLALVVRAGMATYVHSVAEVTAALRRIEVLHARYEEYLTALPARSFDVVYFDPMFQEPVEESRHMEPLRALANPTPLHPSALDLARRVARRRVVVKDRSDGPYVSSGWFDRVVGGPRSRIAYGVIDVGGGVGFEG